MTEKTWLIRTHKNQILGPVSKDKILEFLKGGALSSEDELMTGNGYWFWVRETELVERYLNGDMPQTFNPISEARDVLTSSLSENKTASISRIPSHQTKPAPKNVDNHLPADDDLELPDPENLLPAEDDLEFPDMGEMNIEVSASQSVSVSETKKKVETPDLHDDSLGVENIVFPDDSDLELPTVEVKAKAPAAPAAPAPKQKIVVEEPEIEIEDEIVEDEVEIEDEVEEEVEEEKPAPPPKAKPPVHPAKKKGEGKTGKKRTRVIQTPVRNDNYLKYVLIVIVICVAAVLYYYFKLLKNPIHEISSLIINDSYAQDSDRAVKKKAFLT